MLRRAQVWLRRDNTAIERVILALSGSHTSKQIGHLASAEIQLVGEIVQEFQLLATNGGRLFDFCSKSESSTTELCHSLLDVKRNHLAFAAPCLKKSGRKLAPVRASDCGLRDG